MVRRCALAVVLGSGCGPLVPVNGDTGDDSGNAGDDDAGDDRPGTGPAPTSAATSASTSGDEGPIEDGPEGEVDEGWHPDVWNGVPCSEAELDACYFDALLEVSDEVLLVGVENIAGDEWPELVVMASFAISVYTGQGGAWSNGTQSTSPFGAPTAIAFGAVLGDAEVDLVAIEAPFSAVWLAAGDGAGHFALPIAVDIPGVPEHLEVADVDDDGEVEPIVTLADGRIVIVRSTHDGSPQLELIDSGISQVDAFEVRSLGIGGPGQDLLVAGVFGDEILLHVARYEDAVSGDWIARPFFADSVGLGVRDVDGDAAIDVATASGVEPFALLYRGYGDGAFLEPNLVELPAPATVGAGGRFTPELDGLVAVVDGTPILVDFSAGATTALSGPLVRGPLVVADFNGDAISDIVAPTMDGFGVAMYWSQE